MIEAIVFLWLILMIFIDIRIRSVEKKLNALLKRDKNESETINS